MLKTEANDYDTLASFPGLPCFCSSVFFFVVVFLLQTKNQKLGRLGNESNGTQGQSEAEKELSGIGG